MPTNRHMDRAQAEVYAGSLIDAVNAASGTDGLLAVRSQLDAIVAYNRSHVDLLGILHDEGRTPEQRGEFVRKVFADCDPALVGVLGVMAERHDLADMLPRVRLTYQRLLSEKLGINVVDVTTRVALDDNLREAIKSKAAADLGGTIVLNETVDPDMLGGIIMNANGMRIDASVTTMLERARTALKG